MDLRFSKDENLQKMSERQLDEDYFAAMERGDEDGMRKYMNGNKEQAKSVINGTLEDAKEDLKDAQKALKDLESGKKKKKGAKRISNPIERAKKIKAAQEDVDKAQQRVDHWQEAVDEFKRREEYILAADEQVRKIEKKEELAEIWSGNVGARFSTPEGEIKITEVSAEDGFVKYELNGKTMAASVSSAERSVEKGEWKPITQEAGGAEESSGSEGKAKTDKQGNPVDEHGKLITEKVNGIDELTDGDFTSAARSVELPKIPENVDKAIGADGKPVIIKKNIFEKNRKEHPDITPQQSREILRKALYSPNLVGQTQPIKRPHYWVAIQTADKNSVVVIEVNRAKDNTEIVGWRFADAKKLEQLKRQAEREGGQFLIQTSEDAAAALSALPSNSSSADKGTTNTGNTQGGGAESPLERAKELKRRYVLTPIGRCRISVNGDKVFVSKYENGGHDEIIVNAEQFLNLLESGRWKLTEEENLPSLDDVIGVYKQTKEKYPDCLLVFNNGDYYDIYMDDAKVAADVLGLEVQEKKGENGESVPYVRFGYMDLDEYLPQLIRSGCKCGISDYIDKEREQRGEKEAESIVNARMKEVADGYLRTGSGIVKVQSTGERGRYVLVG